MQRSNSDKAPILLKLAITSMLLERSRRCSTHANIGLDIISYHKQSYYQSKNWISIRKWMEGKDDPIETDALEVIVSVSESVSHSKNRVD